MKTTVKKPRRIRADGKKDRRGGYRPGCGAPKMLEGAKLTGLYLVKKDIEELAGLFPGISISAIVRDSIKRTISDAKKKQLKLFKD
jgi:hypothetical protein